MVLPLVKPARGYLRASYVGEVGVAGTDVQQSWDLTNAFLPYLRADPMFKGSLVLFVKGAIADVSAVSFLPATGVPETLVLTLTAGAITDEIDLDVWCLQSVLGGLLDGPRVYMVGGGGGGGSDVRQFPDATRTVGQTMMPGGGAPGQIVFTVPIPAAISRSFAVTALMVGREATGAGTTQEIFMCARRDAAGVLQFSSSDINLTLRDGSGSNKPDIDGGGSDADNIWATFTNAGNEVCVDWEYSISPPLVDGQFAPIPVPP